MKMEKIAKGYWQREILKSLIENGAIYSPIRFLRGKAKNYSLRYQRSFNNLLKRMEENGYIVIRVPGVRGGEWTAKYILIHNPVKVKTFTSLYWD